MRKNFGKNKGSISIGTIILLVAAAVVVITVIGFLSNGFGFGGGKGNGEGAGDTSIVQSQPETESKPVLEEMEYINVTVSENEYLYGNSKVKLDDLMDKLKTDAADTKVKVTDENASKRAYKDLISALEDNRISYIKADA